MKKFVMCALAVLVALPTFAAAQNKTQDKTQTASKAKGEKPAASPGWIVIEEEYWTPLRFEPIGWFESAEMHYRQKEEKLAANEIDKAVSWLKLAEGHALPLTKSKLSAAAKDLELVSKDLKAGKLTTAEKLDASLANAAAALSEWHFYKAKESWGKNEEVDAGRDLATAAGYLKNAADSADYEFADDTNEVITDYFDHGWWEGESVSYDHSTLGKHLTSIEKGLKGLSEALIKNSK